MDLAYLTVNAATHFAFALVFLFFYLQKRSGFALALTTAWTIQALRIEPLIRQAQGASVSMIEWAAGDCLFPIAMSLYGISDPDSEPRACRAPKEPGKREAAARPAADMHVVQEDSR
jgi:hypothetical protein